MVVPVSTVSIIGTLFVPYLLKLSELWSRYTSDTTNDVS